MAATVYLLLPCSVTRGRGLRFIHLAISCAQQCLAFSMVIALRWACSYGLLVAKLIHAITPAKLLVNGHPLSVQATLAADLPLLLQDQPVNL